MGSSPVKPRDPPPPLEPKPRRRSANGSASAAGRRPVKPVDGPVGDRPSTASQSLGNPQHSTDKEHGSAVESLSNSNGSSTGHSMAAGAKAKAPTSRKGRGKGGMQNRGSGAEPSCSSDQDRGQEQSRRSLQQRRERGAAREARSPVCDYPVQALAAVNDVLFDRHGYRRMDHHGDPKYAPDSLFPTHHLLSCIGQANGGMPLCDVVSSAIHSATVLRHCLRGVFEPPLGCRAPKKSH